MRTQMWRQTFLSVVLGFAAGLLGIWIGLKVLPEQHPDTIGMHTLIHKGLSLNAEQKASLMRLEEQYEQRRKKYKEDLKAATTELAEAINRHHELSPEVQRAELNYLRVLGDFQNETLRHVFAMRAVLNAEQARKFDAQMLRSLHDITEQS